MSISSFKESKLYSVTQNKQNKTNKSSEEKKNYVFY